LKINKNLIAGFTAKWQGKFYDMSFNTGLKKLEENIIKQ
jgi:F0F1-type ATP synthase delta subunit